MSYSGNCRLGDLFSSRREKGRAGLPTLSVTLNDGLVNREDLARKQETSLSPEEHLLVKPGDIVYNMMRMWQGAFGVADCEGIVSPAYVVLKPKSGIASHFAAHFFKSSRAIYLFWAYSHGLTEDRLRLYYDDFARIPATIPSIREQLAIGELIATWDKAIETLEKLVENSSAQRKVLLQKLLTGKKRFSEFSEKWLIQRLGSVSTMSSGGTPPTNEPRYYGGRIPWVSIADMTTSGKYISATERTLTTEGIEDSAAKLFRKGTVLFAMYASIGECCIADAELATSQAILGITPDARLRSEFLYYHLKSIKDRVRLLGQKGTQANINAGMVREMAVSLPSLAEQDQIIAILRTADEVLASRSQELELLKHQKHSLLQQFLNGKHLFHPTKSENQAAS